MLLPKISIFIVTFKYQIVIIQLCNKSFCDIFFRRFSFIKFNPRFSHLYVRNSLPYKTRLIGNILYHAYILKLTLINTKPIFNTYIHIHLKYDLYLILGLFPQLPYIQLYLLTGDLPVLDLYLPFLHLLIFSLIIMLTPHQIILPQILIPLLPI